MREDRFHELFEEFATPLFSFLAYRTGDRVLAEDLVSDTFERALRARSRFNVRRGSEKAWLYAIALNLCKDHTRRRSVEVRAIERVGAEQEPPVESHAFAALELSDELQVALRRLNDDDREVLALRYGADLSIREIARLLKQRDDAIGKRIQRALVKLRDDLG